MLFNFGLGSYEALYNFGLGPISFEAIANLIEVSTATAELQLIDLHVALIVVSYETQLCVSMLSEVVSTVTRQQVQAKEITAQSKDVAQTTIAQPVQAKVTQESRNFSTL